MGRSKNSTTGYRLTFKNLLTFLQAAKIPAAKISAAVMLAVAMLTAVMLAVIMPAAMTGGAFAESVGERAETQDLLVEIAVEFGRVPEKAAPDIIDPPITRREVYKIKPGARITKKELKQSGGAKRYFQIYSIKKGDWVFRRINGRSYRKNPNIKLADLRYIRTLYYDFHGKVRSGEIIVNRRIAEDTRDVFRDLYKSKYQIRKMCLVDNYFSGSKTSGAGSSKTSEVVPDSAAGNAAATAADTASMNDDNTSGFNYRTVAGSGSISMHGYGRAIDVNPFENPWCPGGAVYYNQKKSAEYANRSNRRPHMIYADSKITEIFRKHGFRWLGATAARDYQHFEK